MKTIKRTLALVVVFCLMISFVPVALAADGDISAAIATNTLKVGESSSFTVTYSLAGTASWTEASITGNAFNVTITGNGSDTYTQEVAYTNTTTVTLTVTGTPTTTGSLSISTPDMSTTIAGYRATGAGTTYDGLSNATVTVAKGDGVISIAGLTTSKTSNSITVSGATTTTGASVQYAIMLGATVPGTSDWHDPISGSYTLSGLTANTAYNVYARATADTNNYYNISEASVATAVTTNSVNAVSVAGATGLTYNASSRSLLVLTPSTGYTGTLSYQIDTTGGAITPTYPNSGSLPSAIDAGTYYVYYKVSQTGYDDITGMETVTIAKRTLAPTTNFTAPTAKNLTYTGSAQVLVNAGSSTATTSVAGSFMYALTDVEASYGALSTIFPAQTNAGTYTVYYKYTPSDTANNNVYKGTVSVTISPATGASVTTSSVSTSKTSTSITVTGAKTGSSTTNPKVQYGYATTSGGTITWGSAVTSSTGSTTFSGLASGTTYYIYARTAASDNYAAGSSTYVTSVKTSGDIDFTTVPKSVTATSASTTSIKVSWSASSPTATTYRVYYSTSSSFTSSTTSSTTTSSTSITITGLDKNTKYYFYVVAIKSGYNDGESTTTYATTGGTSNTTDYFVVNTSESSSKTSSSIDAYEFSDAAVGYAQPDPETFWIHNVYGSTIKGITVKLSGTNKSSFTLSTKDTESSLSKSSETSFTLVPNEGLKKGTYECTITISSTTSDVDDYVIDVTFEVGTASLYFSTKKSGTSISSLDFDNAVEGYSISGTQTVYVNNDSGSQLKGIEVALSGTDKSSFKLTGGSLGTIKDGDYESFEIAPVEGLKAGTYTAKLTVSNTTNNKTATMTLNFKVTSGTAPVDTTPAPTASFVDTTSHWAKDYIESLYAQGYVSGIGNSQFAPNNTLTRAQFVQFLYNGFGANAIASACPFDDVEQNAWYKNAVNWAYANGLVTGYSSTEFGPDYSITREQMATIMGRLTEQYGVSLPSTNARAAFADDSDIASYAKDYVYKMQMADIISGKTGNIFDPKGNTTRGEMAKVMYYVLYYAGKIGTAYRVG